MATILVDYENVYGSYGLKGVEYLTAKDNLYIFYSQSCKKIRAEYMEAIEASGCNFFIYKLKNTGKNAMDFYIASQVGECFGKTGETQVAIISNDKGFHAVVDFWTLKEEPEKHIVKTASTVEQGILLLNADFDKNRRNTIAQKAKMLELEQEHLKYIQKNTFRQKLIDTFLETEYEGMLEQILELIKDDKPIPKKELYTGALHNFGKKDGTKIYHLLKAVI